MKFSIQREALLVPISQVVGVVERRQTLPVLANFLLEAEDDRLRVTGSDMEVEMVGEAAADVAQAGSITVPARKLVDICKALPEGVQLNIQLNGEKLAVHAGRSRFTLATLPAAEFPSAEGRGEAETLRIPEDRLRWLLDKASFAMANQDVRHYLNGLLLEFTGQKLRAVATDGHRLSLAEIDIETAGDRRALIVPRKGVIELSRLLGHDDGAVEVSLGSNYLRVRRRGLVITTKLIDGRFPDYEAVIPLPQEKGMTLPREEFMRALQRVAILSNEKYRGIRVESSEGGIRIVAHNPQQEEATEEVEAVHNYDQLVVGFNVNYLMEAVGSIDGDQVRLSLKSADSSCLVTAVDRDDVRQVVMPLKL
ncbi:MAG: DNA polymerase III subunit beta [Wenzhouxiangellaceae bacterium]|nr:DNA polymerase III subunit beta [Wenzhouxiangellaceae bacterium]